ncbi:MAG: PrsW family intramembrane metalloprotease [Limnochordales bacterium]|nr:PrsW family intramembrane metalloprotease [Limnochordales bacterium]
MQAFLLSLLFGLAWVLYFARQDRHPEPAARLLLTFAAGGLFVLPASLIELALRRWIGNEVGAAMLAAFLVVAPVEELAKALAAYGLALRTREADEPADYYIYLVVASLGFATLENVYYTRVLGMVALPLRAAVTSLAHASFSAWVAYGWARGNLTAGLVLATVTHGAYDSLLLAGGFPALASLLVVAAGLAVLAWGLRAAQQAG